MSEDAYYVILICTYNWVGYCIILVVAHDFDRSDDAGYQGVPVITRFAAPIPNSFVPTRSAGFVLHWLLLRYYSCCHPWKC